MPVTLLENEKRHGVGYESSLEGILQQSLNLEEKGSEKKKQIPHLREMFPAPTEVINEHEASSSQVHLMINTLGVDIEENGVIQLLNNKILLSNWQSNSLIDVVAKK